MLSLVNIKFCLIMSISKGMAVLIPITFDIVIILPLLPLHIYTHPFYISFLLFPSTLSPVAAFSTAFNDSFEV